MTNGPWFVYIVQCNDNTLYTGVTTNLDRRVTEHNGGSKGAKYTRARRPVELVYWESYDNRSNAQKAESYFKSLTRDRKIKIINESR